MTMTYETVYDPAETAVYRALEEAAEEYRSHAGESEERRAYYGWAVSYLDLYGTMVDHAYAYRLKRVHVDPIRIYANRLEADLVESYDPYDDGRWHATPKRDIAARFGRIVNRTMEGLPEGERERHMKESTR